MIKTEADITADNLKKMTKLTNFLNEVLRTNTPVPGLMSRVALKDLKLGKYIIKKGANISVAMV